MKENIGTVDKIIRISIALLILALYGFNIIGEAYASMFIIISGIFILTSIACFCPFYRSLSISTLEK